ncbi:MAG: hypothetical protein ACI35S_09980 [Anaeroplasma sp.]
MKKKIIILVLSVMMLLSISSCKNKGEKIEVSMYLWDKSMTSELTPWLEEKFPEIDFNFVIGYNSIDYFIDLNNRDYLPDIITCRRFSLNDAVNLSEYLLDLSESDVVGSFYDSYISYNREEGGAIRWLPMCAEVDGYIANVDIFKNNDIKLPTNYQEFVDACKAFENLGIKGYLNDYKEDYSCLEALQGSSITKLMKLEGMMWRTKYESFSKETTVLNNSVWTGVFNNFRKYLDDTFVDADSSEIEFGTMKNAFIEGKAAIMRGTASDCAVLRQLENMNTVMLPYFGETKEDSWLLTYPTCQIALNKNIENNQKKNDVVNKVLKAIFSDEGQKHVSTSKAVLSYNKDVDIKINDVFSEVKDCINSNHLYIRLASTEMFNLSKNIVQKMITGEYDSEKAYQEFDMKIAHTDNKEVLSVITNQQNYYDYKLDKDGNPAQSSFLNTLRKGLDNEIAIGYSTVVTSPIFKGEYNQEQISWLAGNKSYIRQGQLTKNEIITILEWLINVKEDGSNPIRHRNLIPVVSGMEYVIKENKNGEYSLIDVTVNGRALEDDKLYSVVMFGDNSYIIASNYGNCPLPDVVAEKMIFDKKITAVDVMSKALEGGKQFEAPSKYVTIK